MPRYRRFWQALSPGTEYVQPARPTAPWLVADENDNCLGIFVTPPWYAVVHVPQAAPTPTASPTTAAGDSGTWEGQWTGTYSGSARNAVLPV